MISLVDPQIQSFTVFLRWGGGAFLRIPSRKSTSSSKCALHLYHSFQQLICIPQSKHLNYSKDLKNEFLRPVFDNFIYYS